MGSKYEKKIREAIVSSIDWDALVTKLGTIVDEHITQAQAKIASILSEGMAALVTSPVPVGLSAPGRKVGSVKVAESGRYMAAYNRTHLGTFDTPEEAQAAIDAHYAGLEPAEPAESKPEAARSIGERLRNHLRDHGPSTLDAIAPVLYPEIADPREQRRKASAIAFNTKGVDRMKGTTPTQFILGAPVASRKPVKNSGRKRAGTAPPRSAIARDYIREHGPQTVDVLGPLMYPELKHPKTQRERARSILSGNDGVFARVPGSEPIEWTVKPDDDNPKRPKNGVHPRRRKSRGNAATASG